MDMGKSYQATITLGESTTTDRVLEEFKGVIEQIPPMYSSVKVNGKNYMNMLEKEKLLNGQNDKLKLMKLNEYLI